MHCGNLNGLRAVILRPHRRQERLVISSLLSGTLLGLSVAVPFGPVSLVCVQRTLLNGIRHGIASGVGAATAHGLFSGVAIASAGFIALALSQWYPAIRFVSATVLVVLGMRTVAKGPGKPEASPQSGQSAAYVTGLLLALSNPMTILPYAAIASTSVMAENGQDADPTWAIIGVVLGAASWYTTLSGSVWLLRGGLSQRVLSWLNRLAGAALIGFGILVGLS
jgi:threonine/homoserine/homoserine lactone efflux protein